MNKPRQLLSSSQSIIILPAVNQCEFHNAGLKQTIYGGDFFKEYHFVMRNNFALKCHLIVIRNKMDKQTPTSVFHVAVDKNRFYLSPSLISNDEFPAVFTRWGISWLTVLSIVQAYLTVCRGV